MKVLENFARSLRKKFVSQHKKFSNINITMHDVNISSKEAADLAFYAF